MMKITIEGLEELRVRVNKMISNAQELDAPLKLAGQYVLKSAKKRIDAGGPGWPPNKTGTPLLRRTNRLYNSLQMGGDDNVASLEDFSIRVGTNVVSPKGFPYPRALQEGTGIYGPRGTPIKKSVKINAALGAGGIKKEYKGMKPRPFLLIDDQNAKVIARIFGTYIIEGKMEEPNG